MSSRNAEERIERLERRINGLKHALNELRQENEELRQEVAALQEFESRAGNQLIDLHERLEDHRDQFRQVRVNENNIEDLSLRVESKVGNSAFETMEERFKQLRRRLDYLSDAVDVDTDRIAVKRDDRQ